MHALRVLRDFVVGLARGALIGALVDLLPLAHPR